MGLRRWISSTNSTSRGWRLVRIAARSPGRSSTGPAVWRRLTPSSAAMITASVVLPRPGGPKISTWSSASARWRAASMNTPIWFLTCSWPTYSLNMRGRRPRSTSSSSLLLAVLTRRSSICGSLMSSLARCALQRTPYQLFGAATGAGILDQARGLRRPIAESHQGAVGLGCDAHRRSGLIALLREQREPIAHFNDQAIGDLAADPGNACQRGRVAGLHAARKRFNGYTGQDGQRNARAHPGDLEETAKQRALFAGRKAKQHVGVFPHHQVRQQPHRLSERGQSIERRHRRLQLVADTGHFEQQGRRRLVPEQTRQGTDHARSPGRTTRTGATRRARGVEISAARRRVWAWQSATARASAASAAGRRSSLSSVVTIRATCI